MSCDCGCGQLWPPALAVTRLNVDSEKAPYTHTPCAAPDPPCFSIVHQNHTTESSPTHLVHREAALALGVPVHLVKVNNLADEQTVTRTRTYIACKGS